MDEENNKGIGPVEPTATSPEKNNIVSLSKFKADRNNDPLKDRWPAAIPTKVGEDIPIIQSVKEPGERRILLSTIHGDILMDGFLGLSQTFLAVGDSKGAIKFAVAPGLWMYAKDVTDDPDFKDKPIEPDAA